MMVKDKETLKWGGLHSAAEIEQLITSHMEKAQWNPLPPPPTTTHNAYCANPLLTAVATHTYMQTHTHTALSCLSSSQN